MAKLKTIALESILAAGMLFSPVLAQQKKPDNVATISYFNPETRAKGKFESLGDVKQFVSEKLKGYNVVIKPIKNSEGMTAYDLVINFYNSGPDKKKIRKDIEGIIHQRCDVFSKKDFDDKQEVETAYKAAVIAFYVENNFDSFKKMIANNAVMIHSDDGKMDYDLIREAMQMSKEELKIKNYGFISDFYIRSEKCTDLPTAFKDTKLYTPKEGDYRTDGRIYVKINGKIKDLEMKLIFRKINNQWKIAAFD